MKTLNRKENMQQLENIKVILSGGGTGGHIFPAIAIANAIKAKVPTAEILFVGAKGRMEMEKVPAAGYPIEGLWISGLQRKFTVENLSFPFKVISSLIKAQLLISDFKPDVAIGTGGYASGPTLRAAAAMGIPTLIQEQNSFPGITNKILAKKVDCICVAYSLMDRYFPEEKIRLTGNPIRQDINYEGTDRKAALSSFSLSADKLTVLVVGGSLGARTINNSINEGLAMLAENNIQLIWQTGKNFADTAAEAIKKYSKSGFVTSPFITRMDQAYAAADIVISRAGAIAISELCVVAKPCILVPSPNVTEDHQTKNAEALSGRNAAILITDMDAMEDLVPAVVELSKNEHKQEQLRENIRKMAFPDAANTIADEALKLISKKRLRKKH